MGDASKFEPKFDSEGGDPVQRSIEEFPDPAERALRVMARNCYDRACSEKSRAARLRDTADEIDRDAMKLLQDSMRCEKAAEEIAAPLTILMPGSGQAELKQRVRRLGRTRVMAEMGASGDWMAEWLVSDIAALPATAEAIRVACDALEQRRGSDAG